MLSVPRISSALVTAIIETYFYGVYVVLFMTSVFLLYNRGFRRERSIWMSPKSCAAGPSSLSQ
ncbi:hypothetical protein K438DRAFT_1833637 [Mycena galopus ATCC 62051]|nr:hypothetical protein K438DRAFT_1833637 [Mycena galopus ATCC 62051]